MPSTIRGFGLGLSMLVLAGAAGAETAACTEITSVPTFIYSRGIYCLRSSLSYSGSTSAAIEIVADDVVLDLNGNVLDNSSAGAGTMAAGIHGKNLKNLTVRNGTIRGFRLGVHLENVGDNSLGHVIEDLFLDRNTTFGLHVSGQGSVIHNNRVVRTGGSTIGPDAYGIFAGGAGVHVLDNEVTGTFEAAGGTAFGIYANQVSGGVVERNLVGCESFGPSASTGIFVSTGTFRITLAGNRVTNMRTGLLTASGITSLYLDNVVGGAKIPFSGGTLAGATNFSF